MADELDAFYALYFTSRTGYGVAMVVAKAGKIFGTDLTGSTLDGRYAVVDGEYEIKIGVSVPAGGTTVQGTPVGSEGAHYEIRFGLKGMPNSYPHIRVETPLGPLNVKFVRLRGIDV